MFRAIGKDKVNTAGTSPMIDGMRLQNTATH